MKTTGKMTRACTMSIIAMATTAIIFTSCNETKPADNPPVDTGKQEQPVIDTTSAVPAPGDSAHAGKDSTMKDVNEKGHESKK